MVDQKKRPPALSLTPPRSTSTVSVTEPSAGTKPKPPPLQLRTPRFAEATSVHSPVDHHRRHDTHHHPPLPPTADQAEAGSVGFGYIHTGAAEATTTTKPSTTSTASSHTCSPLSSPPPPPPAPLKSAIRVPGTPAHPLSPTFRDEEEVLEKREAATDAEQVRDLRIKTRVRMAKFALRGVNFSCSLIILAMVSSSFAIFNTTKHLPTQSRMPSWAQNTKTWPQKLVLAMSCLSLAACVLVFAAYCCGRRGRSSGGRQRRADKVSTYYTLFAIGWFIASMLLWVITAALFQNARNTSDNKDMWGWSCVDNTRAHVFHDKVDYALVCRLQNWSLVCILIEVVVEVLCITLYSVVFYRYYTKRRLAKSMDLRDRARSDLYLAQLRSMSAPNTPGGARGSHYRPQPPLPLTPGARLSHFADGNNSNNSSSSNSQQPQQHVVSHFSHVNPPPAFKLQPPPTKARPATPKPVAVAGTAAAATAAGGLMASPTMSSPLSPASPGLTVPVTALSPAPAPSTPSPPPQPQPQPQTQTQHAPKAVDEPIYDAVPIPSAYGP